MESYLEGSDEQLCMLAKTGDRLAEERLVASYTRLVRACTRPYFLVGGDSEDLIQEGMIGLISAIRGYRPECGTTFHSYAEICVQNRIRSVIRSAGRNKHAPLNYSVSLMGTLFDFNPRTYESQTAPQHQENPEDLVIDREEEMGRLEMLTGRLSPLEKKVLEFFLDGLSQGEIAERVQKPAKSVENAVQRIRRKIASCFSSGDFSVS